MHYTRIKELREDNDLTQAQVAKQLNISRTSYGHYETGRREISIEALKKLAKLYHVSVDYLIEKTDDSPQFNKTENKSGS